MIFSLIFLMLVVWGLFGYTFQNTIIMLVLDKRGLGLLETLKEAKKATRWQKAFMVFLIGPICWFWTGFSATVKIIGRALGNKNERIKN